MPLNIRNDLGPVRAHVRPVAAEIDSRWNLYWIWGVGDSGDHAAGKALDFMVYNSDQSAIRTEVGNQIAAYFVANRSRLNVAYVIWRQRIWNAEDEPPKPWSNWRRMENRGGPTANHLDHVHVSFKSSGTYRPPGPVPTPPPKPPSTTKRIHFANVQYGKRNADVTAFQRALIAKKYSIPSGPTGFYGDQTKKACAAFQRAQGWSGADANGLPGSETFSRLGFTNV